MNGTNDLSFIKLLVDFRVVDAGDLFGSSISYTDTEVEVKEVSFGFMLSILCLNDLYKPCIFEEINHINYAFEGGNLIVV